MSIHQANITNDMGVMRADCPTAAVRGRTGGAQSPHLVIRGETSPHENIKTIQQSELVAHNDWLAFTLTPMSEVSANPIPWIREHLARVFGLGDVQIIQTGKGWNGYTDRFNIGEKAQYGLIAYGGEKQRGTLHVELNASVCALVPDWEHVRQWGETNDARITRVDLAHDDFQGELINIEIAKGWYHSGGFASNGRPPSKPTLIDDMDSGEGKTFYIGKREYGKMLRVYEKGRQLGDPSSPWVRLELELRAKSRVIPWDVVISPGTYLAGAYPCLAFLAATQDKIRTISKSVKITLESITRYLRTAGGKSINALMQANGEDAIALIEAIRRDGIPRRLMNYSDFLPQLFEGNHAALVT